MISFIPSSSPLAKLTISLEGYEKILYTLDELKSTVDDSVEEAKHASVWMYTEKMSPLYFGYGKRMKNGKLKVFTEVEALNAPIS